MIQYMISIWYRFYVIVQQVSFLRNWTSVSYQFGVVDDSKYYNTRHHILTLVLEFLALSHRFSLHELEMCTKTVLSFCLFLSWSSMFISLFLKYPPVQLKRLCTGFKGVDTEHTDTNSCHSMWSNSWTLNVQITLTNAQNNIHWESQVNLFLKFHRRGCKKQGQ